MYSPRLPRPLCCCGGADAAAGGFLARRAEHTELVTRSNELSTQVAVLEEESLQLDVESKAAQEAARAANQSLADARRSSLDATHQTERTEQLMRQIERQRDSASTERGHLVERHHASEEEAGGVQSRLEVITRDANEAAAKRDQVPQVQSLNGTVVAAWFAGE